MIWAQDITSVGLMHVGMNIPREFFKPFAVAAMQTFEESMGPEGVPSGGKLWGKHGHHMGKYAFLIGTYGKFIQRWGF